MPRPSAPAGRVPEFRAPTAPDIIPSDPTGLWRVYVARAQRLTEAPDAYHVAALIGAISAVVSPWCSFSFGKGKGEHPLHLWIMLAGPSGNKKTYALDLACRGGVIGMPDGAIAPWVKDRTFDAAGSLRGLEDLVAQQPNVFFKIGEGGAFLAESRGRPGGVSPAWWCKLFDGEMQDRAVRKSSMSAFDAAGAAKRYVLPTLLAATADSALRDYTRPVDWSGGFFARMLIVHAGRVPRRIEYGWWSDGDLRRIRDLIARAESVARRDGVVTWSGEASDLFTPWFYSVADSADGLGPGRSAILERLHRHIRTVAALYALGSGVSVIGRDHMRAAIGFGRISHGSVLGLPID